MSEKKVVKRSVAIALGIVCILLIAGIVGIWLFYLDQGTAKDETITSLNNEIFSRDSQIIQLTTQISHLNEMLSDNQTQINYLNALANLELSRFWQSGNFVAQNPEAKVGLSNPNESFVPYAGYVKVELEPSNSTYIRVVYNSQSANFDYRVPINASGIGIIPVLPTNYIEIGVGNLTIGTTYDMTMTYYY